jgi:microcystin degradation protein MlrC
MVGIYPTFTSPMREIVGALQEAERRVGVLTAGIGHGFPWGDVADVGTRVLVYADADAALAAHEAAAIARRLYDARESLQLGLPDLQTSLQRARTLDGRIVLGDFADNAGGGAPGDSTYFLRALLDGGWRDTVIGFFWDPMVVATCAEAGPGARLSIRLGGKTGPASGTPIDLEVEVVRVAERHEQGVFGARQPMGRSVWLHSAGIDIGVCTVRTQVYEPDAFTGLGLVLKDKRLIVVKSSNHYQAGFQPLADHLWHVGTPGAMASDFASMPYTKRDPDYYPRVADPWARRGTPVPQIFAGRPRP